MSDIVSNSYEYDPCADLMDGEILYHSMLLYS